jgi:hypothetical protein
MESMKSLQTGGCRITAMPTYDCGGQDASVIAELMNSPISSFDVEHHRHPTFLTATVK